MDDVQGSHRSPDETRWDRFLTATRRGGEWLDTVTPYLVPIALLAVLVSSVYVFQGQNRVNSTMDCFAAYTDDRDRAEGHRRVANDRLDDAATVATRTSVRFAKAIADAFANPTDPHNRARIARTNNRNLVALVEVKEARRNLIRVRAANPLPEPCPPSNVTFDPRAS